MTKYQMAWAPARVRLPAPNLSDARRPALGQNTFWESSTLAIMTDGALTLAAAYLGWGFGERNNKWSTFWWVVAGISTVKTLHDMSRA